MKKEGESLYGFMHDITAQCQEIDNCRVGSEPVIMMCGVQISLLSVTLRNAVYTAAHVGMKLQWCTCMIMR